MVWKVLIGAALIGAGGVAVWNSKDKEITIDNVFQQSSTESVELNTPSISTQEVSLSEIIVEEKKEENTPENNYFHHKNWEFKPSKELNANITYRFVHNKTKDEFFYSHLPILNQKTLSLHINAQPSFQQDIQSNEKIAIVVMESLRGNKLTSDMDISLGDSSLSDKVPFYVFNFKGKESEKIKKQRSLTIDSNRPLIEQLKNINNVRFIYKNGLNENAENNLLDYTVNFEEFGKTKYEDFYSIWQEIQKNEEFKKHLSDKDEVRKDISF